MPMNSDFGIGEQRVRVVGGLRVARPRALARVLDAEESAIASNTRARQPCSRAAISMRASFASTGKRAMVPDRREAALRIHRAEFSQLTCQPSAIARGSGGSRKGNCFDIAQTQRQHPQDHVGQAPRRISGSVYADGRDWKSASAPYSRTHTPGRDAAAAALALVGAGLRDRLDVQAIELLPRAVALDPRQSPGSIT
jgi:hypothetical protein